MTGNQSSNTLKTWVDSYSDQMFTWAFYKIGHKEQAEDIVQDTFLAAFQSFEKFEGKSEPKTWLFGILNNKISDHFRKAYRLPISNESFAEQNENSLDVYFDGEGSWRQAQIPKEWDIESIHLLDNLDFANALNGCLGKLPSQWNAALHLKYIEAKKGEIICEELQITPSNFWQVLHRAKLQLRKCLEIHWFKK